MGAALCVDLREDDSGVDIRALPIEIGLRLLEFLSPSDLCNLALVNSQWHRLANHDSIWRLQCLRRIQGVDRNASRRLHLKWKQVYSMIQSFIYCFNENAERGLSMFHELALIETAPAAVARFLHSTRYLDKFQIGRILTSAEHAAVMVEFVKLQSVRDVFLGEVLRDFFTKFKMPRSLQMSRYAVVERLAEYYWDMNQDKLTFSRETTVLLFFSLVLLSTDLSSPHVKNKMTKREFIRNLRNINGPTTGLTTDYLGLLYDFVFLQGLSDPHSLQTAIRPRMCHAVINRATRDRFRPWETYPRILMLR